MRDRIRLVWIPLEVDELPFTVFIDSEYESHSTKRVRTCRKQKLNLQAACMKRPDVPHLKWQTLIANQKELLHKRVPKAPINRR